MRVIRRNTQFLFYNVNLPVKLITALFFLLFRIVAQFEENVGGNPWGAKTDCLINRNSRKRLILRTFYVVRYLPNIRGMFIALVGTADTLQFVMVLMVKIVLALYSTSELMRMFMNIFCLDVRSDKI